MTKAGDVIEFDGVPCRVVDAGPLYVYERDDKGKERAVESGRFVHVERISTEAERVTG